MKKNIFIYISILSFFISCSKESTSSLSSSSTSTAGSEARFIVVGNYLYTINNQNLKSYNITNPTNPTLESTLSVGANIESIFFFKNNLFIGSQLAMYAYDISTPGKPTKSTQVNYIIPWLRAHEPVVANDSLAFSTIRNADGNGGILNMITIKDINNSSILNRTNLQNPYGLGLSDTALYVCESTFGLKVYTIPKLIYSLPILKKTINNNETYYDVIPANNLLYAWIANGNCIFDISDKMNPILLSKTKN